MEFFIRVAIIILLIAMEEVYLLLGSNEGNRNHHLEQARELIAMRCGEIQASSSLYETEAWGLKEQSPFLNQALIISTLKPAIELLRILKAIEKEAGRIETTKWGPRVIDIDILFYGKQIVDLPDLKIPHPYLQQRRFTLVPLNEIAADFIHPFLNKQVKMLLEECPDKGEVTLFRGLQT
jgi:2-amino-4-hydroxy-6-hydroxymethyldihydropteridine diphosphokinase